MTSLRGKAVKKTPFKEHDALQRADASRDDIEAQTAAFIAAGNKVEEVPIGASSYDAAKPVMRKTIILQKRRR